MGEYMNIYITAAATVNRIDDDVIEGDYDAKLYHWKSLF